jgi:hypothetical protein
LPERLERGHVYYLAAGDDPGYRFDDPESGDQLITVVRATAADHGTAPAGTTASTAIER